MNPEVKEAWIQALRSGDYVQGQYHLRQQVPGDDQEEDRYCCLGVLCDLALKEGVLKPQDVFISAHFTGSYVYGGTTSFPPPKVRQWAGIAPGNDDIGKLSDMNDSYMKSFDDISDYIEREL